MAGVTARGRLAAGRPGPAVKGILHGAFPFGLLAGLALLCAGGARAVPQQDDTEGWYRDEFFDATGLTSQQNVKVGPSLQPGVRVSLGKWNWTQSYTSASDTVSTPFSHPMASYQNYDVTVNTCSTCMSESVGLWRQVFRAGRDFKLHPSVRGKYCGEPTVVPDPNKGTVECPDLTHCPRDHHCCGMGLCAPNGIECGDCEACLSVFLNHWVVRRGRIEELAYEYLTEGPFQSGLLPNRSYTATFRTAYEAPATVDTAELAELDVNYGHTRMTSVSVAAGPYGPGGSYWGSGTSSPATLEFSVLDPLPAGNGWEYRVKPTLTNTGQPINPDDPLPPCGATRSCTATLWVDTVTVQSQGLALPLGAPRSRCGDTRPGSPPFKTPADCPAGTVPCGGECIPVGMQCGWDAATYYVDTGSYVSHVFDSLSEKTVWDSVAWEIEQNFTNNTPRTPVAIKWRVGDDPDPTIWLGRPTWYTWTVPFTVTCAGERDVNCDPECKPSPTASPCDCSLAVRSPVFPCQAELFPYVFATVYPPPMLNSGTYPVFAKGDPAEPLRGRYFQYEVDFTSHFANAKFPPELVNPVIACELNDSPTPLLRLMRVFYTPATGRVVSALVKPARLRSWESVKWERNVDSGGTVQVDVLDMNGVPLFTNIPYPEFSLAGLDTNKYPAIRLRATVDNDGDKSKRPTLLRWEVGWDIFTEPLRTECNTVSYLESRKCHLFVTLFAARPGRLTVHDSSGQLVKELFDGVFSAGQIEFTWDGTNDAGERVAPGVYFISLRAKEIRRVARVAVVK